MLATERDGISTIVDSRDRKLLIDGRWVEAASGARFETLNPATGAVIAKVAEADKVDIDKAVVAARKAFEGGWSKSRPYDRQTVLLKIADLVEANFNELAVLDTVEMGAPISRTLQSKKRVLSLLRYYAGMATALHGETIPNSASPATLLSYTLKEPVGVVAAIIPWNAPLISSIWKIGPALATGCTIILKPAEEASLSPLRLGELIMEAGVPPGVVNIVTGFGETAGAALAAHPGVDKIAFTGSTETGKSIARIAAEHLKRLSLELGGKSPNIVFADADLDVAVPGAAMAVFANSGQICSAGTRLFVEESIHDEFVDRVAEYSRTLKIGDSIDSQTQIGPLVSSTQLDRVLGYLGSGVQDGARVVAGGARVEGNLARGYFVSPTVFADVKDDMAIAREEIFGPVVSATPFATIEEAIRRANATSYGLGSGVWTADVRKAHTMSREIRAGSVWVNCYQVMDPAVPFGGYKMSGYGRESGIQQFDEYLNVKAVWINT
jgi:aldehyde dehydrogenase (NAD+)